jgi:hypothetical protein
VRFFARLVGVILAGLLMLPASAAWAGGERALSDPVLATAQTTPPKEWAHDVCTALGEWLSDIKRRSRSMVSELRSAASGQEAKDVLVNSLGTYVQDTDTLLAQIREAGVPKMKDGTKLARVIQNGTTDAREIFAEAQETAANLETTDRAQLAADVKDLDKSISKGGDKLGRTITRAERRYKSPTLDDPACGKL